MNIDDELSAFKKDIADGREHRISEGLFDHFLNEHDPAVWKSQWLYQGRQWYFGSSLGRDYVTVFRHEPESKSYFAQRTPWINPRYAGPVDGSRGQKQGLLLEWVRIGKRHPALAHCVSMSGILECQTDIDLLKRLKAHTSRGFGLFVGDIAFISEGDGNWLMIDGKTEIGATPVEKITQEMIDGIRSSRDTDIRNLDCDRER